MAYVAVVGGRQAIEHATELLQYYRVKNGGKLEVDDILKGMRQGVDRIMSEAGLYAPLYAALALKQAEGSTEEATFLMRAYRSTLPRKHYSHVIVSDDMRCIRKISAAFKDIPGGQILGPAYDYTHRLLDFDLMKEEHDDASKWTQDFEKKAVDGVNGDEDGRFSKVSELLRSEGLLPIVEEKSEEPFDVTRAMLSFPAPRSARLQVLTRGETGAVTAFAYSSLRGYGSVHPTVGELRMGKLDISIDYPLSDDADKDDGCYIGEIQVTEVENLCPYYVGEGDDKEMRFALGYGLVLGQNETKAIAMSILDRTLDIDGNAPCNDEEFILYHVDCLEATGFISHLKLPHYVSFQSELDRVRKGNSTKEEEADE